MSAFQADAAKEESQVLLASACYTLDEDEEYEMSDSIDTTGKEIWGTGECEFHYFTTKAGQEDSCRSRMAREDGLFSTTATPFRSFTTDRPPVRGGYETMVVARQFVARAAARLQLLGRQDAVNRLKEQGEYLFGARNYREDYDAALERLQADVPVSQRGGWVT